MPMYTFKNKDTGDTFTELLTNEQREKFLFEHPEVVQLLTNISFAAGHNAKPDDGFRDILREIKRSNPGSTVNTF